MPAPDQKCAIATLTLNPAVDVTYEVDRLIRDQKVHARHVRHDPGGNGINVGRALKLLGVEAHNFCVVAGEIGELLERLLAAELDHIHPERVAGETRINCTLLELDDPVQYEVSGIGPALDAGVLERIEQALQSTCCNGLGVMTGSIPPGVPADVYGRMAASLRERGGRPVVDTYGELLVNAIAAKPFLIKPNRYELESYCERKLADTGAVAAEARRLQRGGVEYVCVSMGADGAVLCGPENTWLATAPAVKVRSTVGAGDSMVAGLVAALARNDAPAAALRLAVACGTGTTMHPGTELFTAAEVQSLAERIEVSALDI